MTAFAQYTAVGIPRATFNELHTLAAAALTPGDFYQLPDGLVGWYAGLEAAAINDPVTYYRTGLYEAKCNATTDVYAAGAAVYFDTVAKVMQTAPGANRVFAGTAAIAKVSGTSTVLFFLNNAFSILNSTTVTFTGGSGANVMTIPTNLAQGLLVKDSAGSPNTLLTLVTSTGALEWQFGEPLGFLTGTLAATGNVSSGQAQIVNQVTTVTAADGTKAVKLPSPAAFGFVVIINTVANKSLPVAQNASESIDGAAAAITIPGGMRTVFWSDGTNWYTQDSTGISALPDYASLAAAGTNQGTAGVINSAIVNVTAADGTKGVKLPAPAAGLAIAVINTVTNKSLPVYGNASETINGVAGATGVVLLAGQNAIFRSDGTNWVVAGAGWDFGLSAYASLAATGNSQGTAAAIASTRVIVTASDGTKAVKLPAPAPGLEIEVYNSVANKNLVVYGNASETVQGVAGATGVLVLAGSHVVFKSDGTNWVVEGVGWDFNLIGYDNTAPAGSTSGDAAQIIGTLYWPASGGVDGTKGSKLPAPAPGLTVTVVNDHATNALKIYSASGNIDGTIGTTAKSVAGTKSIQFRSDGTNWRSLLTA